MPNPWAGRFRVKNQAPFSRVAVQAIVAFLENDLPTSSAAISYYMMLLLFPFLVLVVSIGQLIVGGREVRQFVIVEVLRFLPGTHQFVRENLESIESLTPGAIAGCMLFILWAAQWIFTVIERALNRIWMTHSRSFVKGRLLTTGMVGASGAILLLSALLTACAAFLQTASSRVPLRLSAGAGVFVDIVWQVLFAALSLVVTVGLFTLIYKVMPNTRVEWTEALPSAAVSGIAWELLKYGFAYLMPYFLKEYRALYGGIWLALVLLTWVYISSMVMLFGAQLTALLHCEHVFTREPSFSAYPVSSPSASSSSAPPAPPADVAS